MNMKSIALIAPLLVLGTLRCLAAPDILTVAVFDFESKDENVLGLGPKISALVAANFSMSPRIITVERADLEKVLGEHEMGLSGGIAPGTEAKVGNLTGAKVLVTGRVFKAEKNWIVVVKVVGTETSRVYGDMVETNAATASLSAVAAEVANRIAKTVADKGDTLVAKVQTREERIAKIKERLGAAKLPSVSVKIGERHFGQPVIDPAAETELEKILHECGFQVMDDKSPGKADFEITGDAFSAFGLRKGNLTSCKARVEVKGRAANGTVVFADSQSSVAVDVAEQTAAKTALENAALELAARVLPQLAQ